MGYYTEGVFVTNSSSVGQERELGARVRGGEMHSIICNLVLNGSLVEAISDTNVQRLLTNGPLTTV